MNKELSMVRKRVFYSRDYYFSVFNKILQSYIILKEGGIVLFIYK